MQKRQRAREKHVAAEWSILETPAEDLWISSAWSHQQHFGDAGARTMVDSP